MRFAIALTILLATECLAQVSSSISLTNGVQLTIACNSNRSGPGALKIELKPASGNSFYRIFGDENNLAVFAYELLLERTPDGDHFRVTAKPITSLQPGSRMQMAESRHPPCQSLDNRRCLRLATASLSRSLSFPASPQVSTTSCKSG